MKCVCILLAVAGLCSPATATGQAPQNHAPRDNVPTPKSGMIVSVTEFGVEPDSRVNAVKGVRAAIQTCREKASATLVFPKGRYDFWPQHAQEKVYYESNCYDNNPKTCAILIEDVKGLTIDGSGSEFVFHGRIQPFTVERCECITIENLTIDWDVPLTAQGKVVAVADDTIDLEINGCESPYVIENGKIVFVGEGWKSRWGGTIEFEADTHLIPPGGGDGCMRGNSNYRAEELKRGLVRLHNFKGRKPARGNFLVMRHSSRDHAGIFLLHSKDLVLRNIDMCHCGGLGVLAQFSQNVHLDRCHVRPNPAKGRYLSGHDDGAQISNCRGLVRIENCEFAGLMDDPINVHGTSVRIIRKTAPNQLVCRFMHSMSVGMQWGHEGDMIAFIENESMHTFAQGTVRAFRLLSITDFELTLEAPIPGRLAEGDALENLTWSPDVEIRNCKFGSCRARGLLVTTPGRVVIESNVFESSGSAILISGDANGWYESGAVRDVLIRGNTFEAPCMTNLYQFCEGIISIFPIIPAPEKAPEPFHGNIRIEENVFHAFDYPVLYAKSVDGLTFSKNRIVRSTRYQPYHRRKHMLNLEYCRQVTIAGNRLEGDVLGQDVYVERMNPAEVTVHSGQRMSGP
ncbi:MAG: hypothetical protein JW741_11865 [Sedimentisphaerales bacterium]|nr:hypothetical protein [Sedimentisphaerales bacterium]